MSDDDRNKIIEAFEWIAENWIEVLFFVFMVLIVGKCAIS